MVLNVEHVNKIDSSANIVKYEGSVHSSQRLRDSCIEGNLHHHQEIARLQVSYHTGTFAKVSADGPSTFPLISITAAALQLQRRE
jgi:hypothetical protein